MLQNRIYRGEIVHQRALYPGEHAPIVDEDLWSSVQRVSKPTASTGETSKTWARQIF